MNPNVQLLEEFKNNPPKGPCPACGFSAWAYKCYVKEVQGAVVCAYCQLSDKFNRCASKRHKLEGALRAAINTVECASRDCETGEELPWHKQAECALAMSGE